MTTLTPFLTACPPRPISQAADQYAAELIGGIREDLATPEKAADFLKTTHLTATTRNLLRMVMDRMENGASSTSPSIFQLYSRYGGGKTHGMLVMAAAALHPHLDYWKDTAQTEAFSARVIAFNGENSNPTTGMNLDDQGLRAKSLAGFLLYHLGGPEALKQFQDGDHRLTDPGADEFRRLIGDQPAIIMIDELVHYVNKVRQRIDSGDQVSMEGALSTVSALASAVSSCPNAVMIITSPEDAHELLSEQGTVGQGDAFQQDALILIDVLGRINSQLARQTQPVAPSDVTDLPDILRAKLFYSIDDGAKEQTTAAYASVASRNNRSNGVLTEERFKECYPFHPSVLNLVTGRLADNRNFQRVRGTLRLLGNTVLTMGNADDPTPLIHPHHIDPSIPAIRNEMINRIGFESLDPAIDTDVIGPDSTSAKTGEEIAVQAAKTVLLGTLAPDNVNGLYDDQIADAILSPEHQDYGVVATGVQSFLSRAIHVDDNAGSTRKRFSREPNVMKQLIEVRDSIRADTQNLEALLRRAITSAYSGGNRQNPQMRVTVFPNRASNVPDDAEQVHLGIVNPDFFNWADYLDSTMKMSNGDLMDLYSHNMGNNGTEPRRFRNNAMFLVPQDRNLESIRESIATMEAADRLLKDPSQNIPEHRKETLKGLRADAEKNATTGIQNKWSHLICPGISDNLRWPTSSSTLEHRPLSSAADPAGNGQKQIIDQLGDRMLHGTGANISPNAWAQIAVLRGEEGITLRDLREYFAARPAERSVLNQDAWLNLVSTGIQNGGLYVETQAGEVNPTSGYDANWKAWATPYKPDRTTTDPLGPPDPPPGPPSGPPQGPEPTDKPKSIETEFTQAGVAANAVKEFMEAQGYTWDKMKSCTITATTPEFADHVASIPQGAGEGILMSLTGFSQAINLELRNLSPQDFKKYSSSARRMLQLAEVGTADVTIRTDAKGAEEILGKLNNSHTARIRAEYE